MSLQHAAKHLASKGRGDDKVLVHMTRGEVKSLNDLAMAHGGQLTINPETGLPEAGFLSAILPMVAGAALGPAGLGLSAMQAGLLVGAGAYALNPKGGLMGGLSAGFGGYGGAGLGNALAAQGMEQATAASLANNPEYLAQQEAIKNATTSQLAGGANALSPEAYADQMRGLGTSATNTYNTAYNAVKPTDFLGKADMMGQGIKSTFTDPNGFNNLTSKLGGPMGTVQTAASALAPALLQEKDEPAAPVVDKDMGQRYSYSAGVAQPQPAPDVPSYDDMLTQQGNFGRQQNYYPNQRYTPISNEQAKDIYGYANGGMPIEQMSNQAMMGANTMYPMSNMATSSFATPYQSPVSTNMLAPSGDTGVGMSGEPNMQGTRLATGGLSDARYNLGGYSDGGRLLRGPGDGVSDSIPAVIGKKQPARLADGEFVVPARIVSEIGNGSTEAGARKLYAMMDRVQAARKKTVGKDRVAHNSRADKYLPA